LTIDLLTSHLLLKELVAENIYGTDGENDFSPRSGETVFDIGSQQGIYTVLAAKRVGESGKVLSVEPEPDNFSMLSRNCQDNGLKQVTTVQAAVSDHLGLASLYRSDTNTGAHSLVKAAKADVGNPLSVRLITLDSLQAETGLRPHLIKIDVEGSAHHVVSGGLDLIQRDRPRMVVELDHPEDMQWLQSRLAPLNYRLVKNGNNLFAWP
jgi:FkbM family methyltransferase